MNSNQPSLFPENELARMISPTFSRKRNHAEWELRKSRLGAIRAGLSEGGTVAISTNGVQGKLVSLRMFREGVFELERQLRPEAIFIYGDKIELKTKARQIWHPNTHIKHLRNIDGR